MIYDLIVLGVGIAIGVGLEKSGWADVIVERAVKKYREAKARKEAQEKAKEETYMEYLYARVVGNS